MKAMTIISRIIRGIAVIMTTCLLTPATAYAAAPQEEASEVIFEINQVRKGYGLTQLSADTELANVATVRAEETSKSFSHTRPDGTPWWTVNEDIAYGENLAKGYTSASDVFAAWMQSTSHKDNILDPDFDSVSIRIYVSDDGTWYWASEFGDRR